MTLLRNFTVKKFFWQTATIIGIVILFFNPINTALHKMGGIMGVQVPVSAGKVEASEIYSMFTCPCCGQPLNKEKPCCESMTQMIDFIDQKISTGIGRDEVILATVQEFGLERLSSESERTVLKVKLSENAPKDSPKITVSEAKRDLGAVSIKKGIVTTEFNIKNDGKSNLVINKLSSSCGCTSASIVYQSTEGPRFYMAGHGQEAPDPNWKVSITPGDEAVVKIYYDPSVHPDLTGPVTREITVYSNDPVEFETKFTITLNQER